jgi:hypothetical protein
MREFKNGELTSNGRPVTDRKQAIAIALNTAGVSRKMERGGRITDVQVSDADLVRNGFNITDLTPRQRHILTMPTEDFDGYMAMSSTKTYDAAYGNWLRKLKEAGFTDKEIKQAEQLNFAFANGGAVASNTAGHVPLMLPEGMTTMSSGTMAGLTGLERYDDIDKVEHALWTQVLSDGDYDNIPYNFEDARKVLHMAMKKAGYP